LHGLTGHTAKDGRAEHVATSTAAGTRRLEASLRELIELTHADSFVPKKRESNSLTETSGIPAAEYVKNNPGLRIALLHFDCDMYEPTLAV